MLITIIGKTASDFTWQYDVFRSVYSDSSKLQILDREGKPLTFLYQNRWNTYDSISLHDLPELLPQAFVAAEDKRFYEHLGVDLYARATALWQMIWSGDNSRGASTITEQVVRILHPRKRSYWSKWIEGLEAIALEKQTSKADLLEFYLNQVPYASNRRGVVQAAKFYFDRDVSTLSTKEILALAVLVRAPSKFDLYTDTVSIEESITRLAKTLADRGQLNLSSYNLIKDSKLTLKPPALPVDAFHFIDYVRTHSENQVGDNNKITTTLDADLQQFTQRLLENRLKSLSSKNINQAAALIVNHQTHEVIAWVSVGAHCKESGNQADACKIDMVMAPRQPGSALKPFLYAAAFEKGWTAATILDDSPYSETVGKGIHHFHNASNTHYGKVSVRTALGNSLNIPALHAINYITPNHYLKILQGLGFDNLTHSANHYDEGLALGNGEVSLFELVQAYTALANLGKFAPLKVTLYGDAPQTQKQIYSEEVSSLIGNILSDPWARSIEFGKSSVLNMPTQTAVKTGTSNDYRDAWAVGYNYKYVVGIWMGNADNTPTDGITGSLGPSLPLRGIFNELTNNVMTFPLYLSPKLIAKDICIDQEQAGACATYTEYFTANSLENLPITADIHNQSREIMRPANGLEIAFDPRIPSEKQMFEMHISGVTDIDQVEWIIDEAKLPKIAGSKFLWPVQRGKHSVKAVIWRDNMQLAQTSPVWFIVK